MCAIQKVKRATDWYDVICQRLDALREDSHKYRDPDVMLPADGLFELVKKQMQDIRQLAGFPTIPVPDVWLGPDAQIGLTWDAGERSIDLIFGVNNLTARLTDDLHQQLIETKDVPLILAQLAA